ncbi:uncharacterized protein LOC144905707 [Branchiostoma floridae x Branchiostoma belcheri]
MGVLDRTASAFLTVVHALSVLRPGGKSRDGQHKLNVTVHEGKVGHQSQSKYLVTLRVGKEKKETKKRRSDGLIWDYEAEFLHWTPADPLILKLRKAKRCKDKTVAVLSLDVAAAIESVDGLPNRWWYALDRIDKSGRQKEEAFLQVTVTVDGVEGKHGSTQDQDHAKPVHETVQPAVPENPEITSPPSAGGDAVAAPSSTTSSAPSQSAKPSTKGKVKLRRERCRSYSQDGEINKDTQDVEINEDTQDVEINEDTQDGEIDEDTQDGEIDEDTQDGEIDEDTQDVEIDEDTQDGEIDEDTRDVEINEDTQDINEGTQDVEINEDTQDGEIVEDTQDGEIKEDTQDGEINEDTQDEEIDEDTQGWETSQNTQDGDTEGTLEISSTTGKGRPRCSSVSSEGEAGTSESSRRTDTSPPSAAGDVADDKPESSPTTSSPPVSSNTPDQTDTSCTGEGDVMVGPEGHSSRDKDVEVSPVSIDVDSSTGYIDSGRGEDTAKPGFPEKTVSLEKPETSADLKEMIEGAELVEVITQRATTVDNDSGRGKVADEKPESSPTTGPTSSPPASYNTPDQAATSGGGEGDVMAGPEGHSSCDKDVEVSPVSIDVDRSTGYIDSGRDPGEPGFPEKTVPLEKSETPAELKEMIEELEVPQVDTTVDNDSGQGQVADEKPESSPTTGPTSSPPASSNTDQTDTSCKGEGDVKPGPEGHSSRDKDEEKPETSAEQKEIIEGAELEVPQVVTTAGCHTEDNSGRSQASAETEPPKHTESPDNATSDADSDRPDTASSPQGGGVALPLPDPPPRHKDADDPTYELLILSIQDKWEDIMSKKQYADELYTYANSLRSKLEATVPHVLNYPVIKNLAAKVPKCPEYELPDTQGMSLEDLQHIRDTLTKLSLKEEERATYLRRWYIDELCAVAMREAPQVLET